MLGFFVTDNADIGRLPRKAQLAGRLHQRVISRLEKQYRYCYVCRPLQDFSGYGHACHSPAVRRSVGLVMKVLQSVLKNIIISGTGEGAAGPEYRNRAEVVLSHRHLPLHVMDGGVNSKQVDQGTGIFPGFHLNHRRAENCLLEAFRMSAKEKRSDGSAH